MDSSEQDTYLKPSGDLQYDKESLVALQAAMMEELGFARKENLPLEDRKGFKGPVDLDALDRQKKAKDPCTFEYRIAKENATAHAAWKSVRFDDIDQATLSLDTMNLGQSHRARMMAELQGRNSSRGGHSHRGGRGGPPSRGGGFISNTGGSSSSRRRRKHVPLELVMAHLGENDTLRGVSAHKKQSFDRGGATNTARHGAVPKPEPNLSFQDKRSINELPIRQNIANYAKSGDEKGNSVSAIDLTPTKHRQSFVLADPDKFMAVVWPDRVNRETRASEDGQRKTIEYETLLPTTAAAIIPHSTSEKHQKQSKTNISATIDSDLAERSPRTRNGKSSNVNYRVVHEVEVKLEKVEGLSTITLGQGMARLLIDIRRPRAPGVIEIEVEREILLEIQLSENSRHTLDSSTVSFDLSINENSLIWILRTPLPWKAKKFSEEIDRRKSLPIFSPQNGSNVQNDVRMLSSVADIENLISFEEEEHLSPQYPSFTKDLLSLMDDQTIDKTLEAINPDPSGPLLDQISTIVAETSPAKENLSAATQMKDIQVSSKVVLGGLATSRFAAATNLVDKFLSKSCIYKSLPVETAVALTEKISKRGLAKAEQSTFVKAAIAPRETAADLTTEETCGILVEKGEPNNLTHSATKADLRANNILNVKKRGHLRYATEEMMSYRKYASQIINPQASAPWVSPINRQNYRSSARLETAIVSNTSSPHVSKFLNMKPSLVPTATFMKKSASFEGLAISKYAIETPTNNGRAETLSSKTAHEGPSTEFVGKAPEFRGLDHSKYSSSTNLTATRVTKTSEEVHGEPAVLSIIQYSSNAPIDETASMNRMFVDLEPKTRLDERGTPIRSESMNSGTSESHGKNAKTPRSEGKDAVNVTSPLNKANEYAERSADLMCLMDVASNKEFHLTAITGSKNFQRRDSFDSSTSKDSAETVKPIIYKARQALKQTLQDDTNVLPRVVKSSQHVSALNTGSDINFTSFTTAIEDAHPEREHIINRWMDVSEELKVQREFDRPVVTQHAHNGHGPEGTAEPSVLGVSATISTYRTKMSDFAADLKAKGGLATSRYAAAPKLGYPSQTNSPTRPYLSPSTKLSRTEDSSTKNLLHTSKAAGMHSDNVHDNKTHALQPRVRPAAEIIRGHLEREAQSQELAPKAVGTTQGDSVNKSPLSLRPTATEFTPPNTSILTTPRRNIFVQPMAALTPTEPLFATVLVPDGIGGYREVSGILAATRVKLPPHEPSQPLGMPVDENVMPWSLTGTQFPQSTMQLHSQSPLATSYLHGGSSAHDFQQGVPNLLHRSLALRKSSQ